MLKNLDIASIENDLRLDGQQPYRNLEWLEDSYRNPGDFWRSLKGAFDARFAAKGISTPFSASTTFTMSSLSATATMPNRLCAGMNLLPESKVFRIASSALLPPRRQAIGIALVYCRAKRCASSGAWVWR